MLGVIIFTFIKIAIMLGGFITLAALLTWAERKQSAAMQDRIGPNRASIFGKTAYGLFHPMADGIKLITKEDFVPEKANKMLHTLAPCFALFPALVTYAIIPFGDVLRIGNSIVPLQVADLSVGILFIFSFSSIAVYGIMLGGWASYNNYSLIGGLRGASQMISYEVAMGLSVIGVLMVFQSIRLDEIVRAQGVLLGGWIPKWGVIVQPVAFIIFMTAIIAENKRTPFDLPEGESEIIGYFLEYSSMKWGMFYLGEFIEVAVAGGLITTLFFGGWQIPYLMSSGFHFPWGTVINLPHLLVVIMQVSAFFIKTIFFCWFMLLIRWTFPRFRYDQLMWLGWKGMLPICLANIFITGVVLLWLQ